MTPPDSGEHEVCSGSGYTAADGKCGICGSVVRIDSEGRCATHPFPRDARCHAKVTVWCPIHGALIRPDHRHGDPVSVPLSLAQRILAALEGELTPDGYEESAALAAELRAIMERKP